MRQPQTVSRSDYEAKGQGRGVILTTHHARSGSLIASDKLHTQAVGIMLLNPANLAELDKGALGMGVNCWALGI